MKSFKEHLEETKTLYVNRKRNPRTIVYNYPIDVGAYGYSMTVPPTTTSGVNPTGDASVATQ